MNSNQSVSNNRAATKTIKEKVYRKHLFVLCVLILMFFSAPGFLHAAKVAISGPTTISQPGSYYLNKDISSSFAIIEINADHVTLDLDGHVLTGLSNASNIIQSTGHSDIRITNGKLVNGAIGIYLQLFGGDCLIDHLTFVGQNNDAIYILPHGLEIVQSRAIVEDNVILKARNVGIQLITMRGARVEHNTIRGSNDGIDLETSTGCSISDNVVIESTGVNADNINVTGSFNSVERNTVAAATRNGIVVNGNGNTIDWNLSSGNGSVGIFILGSNNAYSNNRSLLNGTAYSIDPSTINGGGNL